MLRDEYIKELGTSNIDTRYFHLLLALSDLHVKIFDVIKIPLF